MNKYIGIKVVDAEQMTRHEAFEKGCYRLANGETIENQPNDNGYHVKYDDGYDSWCPAEVFEKNNKPINTLRETAIKMNSNDYKDRFIAEYVQLNTRYWALVHMCETWDTEGIEGLGFTPTCPRDIYDEQLRAMGTYMTTLEVRAELENINLHNTK